MRLKFFAAFCAVLFLFSMPAYALDLQDARASGQVGELQTGYVQGLVSAADVTALVNEVNGKRTAEYARISKENGQSVAVVAKIAAERIIAGLPAGAKYQGADGSWKTK